MLAIAAAGLLVAGLAACGSASSGPGGGASAPASAPAPAAWRSGGTYTGPVPAPASTGLPEPNNAWQLAAYTNPDGYKMSDRLIFGVPLHYAIPHQLIDCYGQQPVTEDLPPGQYVIPFEMRIANETGQQAPAFAPLAWVADADGTVTLGMTGGMHGGDTWGLWQDGSCTNDDQVQLNAGGSTAIYGFIGPGTPAQLAGAYVYVSWATGNNVPGTPPQLSQPLMQLLPAPAVTWLKAHGGQAPQAAPGPVSSPTSCPSAPAGDDAPQKIAFSTACAGWLGDVDQQLQWDHGDPHSAEVSDCERSDDTQVEGATMQRTDLTDAQLAAMKAHLLSACLAGVKAAGAP